MELRKKKQHDIYHFRENDELYEERIKVNQQERKTPGRRIDEEIVRRDKINNNRISAKVIVLRKSLL